MPAAGTNTVPVASVHPPFAATRTSTLPVHPAPTPPLPERPPRYEDLFPVSTSAGPLGAPVPVTSYPGMGHQQQAPPPRYSFGYTSQRVLSQPPLPSKPEHPDRSDGEAAAHSQVSENDYYSPPLDRQQSNEYSSPTSDSSNIYEEIGQVCRRRFLYAHCCLQYSAYKYVWKSFVLHWVLDT